MSAPRKDRIEFDNPYRHGMARVAVAIPRVRVADPEINAKNTIELAQEADRQGAALAVFPELGLSSYAIDDLLHQDALLDSCLAALSEVAQASLSLRTALAVGMPLRSEQRLFNCAAIVHAGRVRGVVPKSYLPNYREYYEKRHFSPSVAALDDRIELLGESVPFTSELLFDVTTIPGLTFFVELCEDLWTPLPPSTFGALSGATVLLNLSASNVTIDKAKYRRALVTGQSARTVAAYLYAGTGAGESSTDLAWDAHGLVAEYGELLGESERFAEGSQILVRDIDLDRIVQERSRLTSWNDTVERYRDQLMLAPRVELEIEPPAGKLAIARRIERFPYVPADEAELDQRCTDAYRIQIRGLTQRLEATGIEKLVIGISGGLDSTHALVIAVRALETLGLSRRNVLAYTMPGFATTESTKSNAHRLMKALGVSAQEIDIRPSCRQMLEDLEHPFIAGEPAHDVTFENVQAGERTSHLFRLANMHRALVVGTGDLSELALGWCTYGVGDHMSHYNVNASVPKTLIQHLIGWVIKTERFDEETRAVLTEILATEITPELVPAGADGEATQSTEAVVGPYALQDFHLYYTSRFGYRPSKVAYLAWQAWRDAESGAWPATVAADDRRAFDLPAIKHWLAVFLRRFFEFSQFKRSAMPNGPKVGSGGSLSPRGDWRAPSDASARAWLDELERNVP